MGDDTEGGGPLELAVQGTLLEPDDAEMRGVWREVTLRFAPRKLAILDRVEVKGQVKVYERTFLPVRWPWLVQAVLTPFKALSGIAFSWRDVKWVRGEGGRPVLEIRAYVPHDFWVGFRFSGEAEARKAAAWLDGEFGRRGVGEPWFEVA